MAVLSMALLMGMATESRALTNGDVAIVFASADANDYLGFVALTNIPANTTIYFSDLGWTNSNRRYSTSEGKIRWSHTAEITAGTLITLTNFAAGALTSSVGRAFKEGSIDVGGTDSILVSESNSTLGIWHSFGMKWTTTWGSGTGPAFCEQPSELTNATMVFTSADNFRFNRTLTNGTKAELLAAITNTANWTISAGPQTTTNLPFTVNNPVTCTPTGSIAFIQQTNHYTKFTSGGDIFNVDAARMGMWANSGSEQVVAWRNFRTDGSGGGELRELQPGDRFRITINGPNPNGRVGVSINDGAATGSWDNRTNNTRGFIQVQGGGANDYFVTHGGGTPSWSGIRPNSTDQTIVFDILSSAEFTANIEGQTAKYDLSMLNSPGDNDRVDGFSLFLNDDAGDIHWKQTTLVTNLGYVEFGADNGTRNIVGKITDGMDPACTNTASPNQLRKTGTGTVTLQNTANTFTRGTRVEAGTLAVFSDGSLGVVPGSAVATNIDIYSSATLRATNTFTLNSNRGITLGNTSGTSIEVDSGMTLTYAGVMGGTADWNKKGSGVYALTGTSSTNSGKVTIQGGTLRISGDQSLGSVPASAAEKINIWSTGTLEADGTFTINANRRLELGAVNGPRLSVSSGNTLTYGGQISGSANWSKEGTGTLVLTGAVGSSSGTLTVNAGTLIHLGTNTSGSATIATSTFFYGNGSIGTLTITGQVSAGNASNTVGHLRVTALNLQTNGRLQVNFSAMTGTAGSDWDLVTVNGGSGTYTVNSGAGGEFVIALKGSPSFNSASGYTNTLIDAGTASGFSTAKFSISTAEFTPALDGGTFSLDSSGGDLRLVFTPAVVATPDIAVLGTNGATVANNDVSPMGADGTDFGSVYTAGAASFTNIFSITNAGNGDLTITAVTTSSTMGAAAEFVVVSWPGTVSPGARSNLVIAFNPAAVGLRTAVVSIANNVSGKNPYQFVIAGTGTGSFTSITFQGFEGAGSDTWNYTRAPGSASVYVEDGTNASGSHAMALRGSASLNADPYVEFDSIELRGYYSVTLQVAYAVAGADAGDDLELDLSFDGGANWTGAGSETLVAGANNTNLGFTGIGATTVGTNPWYVGIPSTATQVKVRIRFDESANDNSFDRYFFDDIQLTGMGSLPTVSFGSAVYQTTETNGTVTIPVSISSSASATVQVFRAGSATAGAGNDYTNNTTNIVFTAGGATSSNLVITINDDTFSEGVEDIQLKLVSASGAVPGNTALATLLVQDDETIVLVSANLTGGTNLVDGTYWYTESAQRLLRRLRPDVLAIQEWKFTNASARAFVDSVFGTNYYFYIEPESDPNPIPNGVISRWPITASNQWTDTRVGARDHVQVTIDIPGNRDLHVVSTHFKAGASDAATREEQARDLTNYIALAAFPTNDYLVIAGDLNLTSRTEISFTILTQLVTDARQPKDQDGDTDTNIGRNSPYDFVLPNSVLNADHVDINIGGYTYADGAVFDSEQFDEHLLPALVGDSYDSNRTHMAVLKLFTITTSATPPTVTTTIASATNATWATSGGNVTSDGGATVTNRGVVWSLSATPTVPGAQTTNGTGTGSFTATLTNLTPGATYYYRAFAQNGVGTSYGAEYSLIAPCFSGVVTGLSVSATNETNFTAVWSNFVQASGYQLDVSTSSTFGVSLLTVAAQGYEGGGGDTWAYTQQVATVSTVTSTSRTGSTSLRIESSGEARFGNVPLTGYSGATVTVAFASVGVDSGEDLFIEFSYDGGATFSDSVKLVDGFSNAQIDFNETNALDPTTTANPYRHAVTATQVLIRVLATGLDASEYYYIDDVSLTAYGGAGNLVPGYSNRVVTGTTASVTGLTGGVTYYFRVRATNDLCVTANSSTGSVTTIQLLPDLGVFGNNTLIPDGDTTPLAADHTDFGIVGINQSNLVRTFTITNSGYGVLGLGSVTTSGAAAADFTVISQPSSPVAVGGVTTFQVRFDPSAAGTRTATLQFTNNVTGKNPYDFVVQGTGVAAGILVSPVSITVTSMVGSAPSARTFGVTNTGRGRLDYSVSTNAAWLSVSPVSAQLAEGAGQTETITFTVAGLSAGTSNATVTITDALASNSPQSVTVALVLTNIPNPVLVDTYADGSEMIRMGWTRPAGLDVLILHRATNVPAAPVDGQVYNTGDAIGSDGTRVIYKGSGSNLEHVVPPGQIHRYAFHAVNNNHYSPGVASNASTVVYDAAEIVEVFAYTNSGTLATSGNGNGGQGWTNRWNGDSGSFNISSGNFAAITGYPTGAANRIRLNSADLDGTSKTNVRQFAAITTGKVYAAYILNYQYNGPNKYAGMSFMDNSTEELYFGEGYGGDQKLAVGGTISSSNLFAGIGNDYVVIGMYDFTADTGYVVSYKIGTDTVPTTEPATWHATVSDASVSRINGIRLAAGAGGGSGTPGDTYFDEIRVATSWENVVGNFSKPEIAVLGTNGSVLTTGNTPAYGNGTDLGATAVTGGQVDRTLFITNSGAGTLNVSGVTTSGTEAAEFIVVSFPAKVSPGTVSNLVVRFDPAASGVRTAAVTVASDDADEGSYLFHVRGTGQVAPTVTTTIASATNQNTATAGGNVTADGFDGVTNRGVVWSLTASPTVPGTQTTNGTGTGSFTSTLTNLTPGATYYYRAFAQNSAGTGYGAEYTLTTPCFTGIVTGHYVSATNDLDFTVTWSNVAEATGYALDVSSNAGFVADSGGSTYTNTWEGASKGAYASGTVAIAGITWWMDDALIGTSASDRKNGSNSARIQNTGSIGMQTSTNMGLSSITLLHGLFGSDITCNGRVEYSTDGWTTWSTAGTFVASSTTLTAFEATNLNVSGNVAIRVIKTSGAGSRVNIDDVRLYPYSQAPAFAPGYSNRAVSSTSATVTGLVSGATYYYRIRATNAYCVSEPSTTGQVTTIVLPASIEVYGNNTLIPDGDTTPTPSDHTDFGGVGLVNSNLVRTFTITNAGPGSLVIYQVTTSGVAASDFVVSTPPGSPVLAGATTTFQVRFDPTATGSRTATLAISNNVTGYSLYDFVVQGTGVPAGIQASPSSLSVTSVIGSVPTTQDFAVTNVGRGDLVYTVSSNVSWLSISPVRGTNAELQGRVHTVTFNTGTMATGVVNGTITIADSNASNTPQTVLVDWTRLPVSGVLSASVTNDGNEMVRLYWQKDPAYSVMIAHRETNAPGVPTNGTAYTAGSSLGSGSRVIYTGTGSNLEHVVRAGSVNHYTFYSVNNNHYSDGLATNTTMGTYASGEVVEPFAYTNGVTLTTRAGGIGWHTNTWLGDTGSFVVVSESFAGQTNYPTPRANKVRVTPGDATTLAVRRQLTNSYASGKIYVSYIVNFQYSGPDKFAGLSLMSNTTEKLYAGEVYTADLRLGIEGASSNRVMSQGTGNDYIVVLRYDWGTGIAAANAYKIGTDVVPESEPTAWDMMYAKASNDVGRINGIRLAAGAGAGTPGDVFFDEVRVATNWTALVQTTAGRVIYDGFAASSGSISGQGGGTGWSDTWTLGGDPFVEYTTPGFSIEKSSYFQPSGNKIVLYGDVDGRWISATRNFETVFTNGTVYFSWIQNYEFNGTDKYAGLKLMDGTTEKAFVGKVSTADKALGISSASSNATASVNLENGVGYDYVIVAKYDFSTRELSATSYRMSTNAIAEEPNGYWQVNTTQTVSHITSLSGVRLAVGGGTGVQVGDVYMDEVRVGTNWFEVTRRDGLNQAVAMGQGPVARLLYVGTNYAAAANPQGTTANITVTDADLINTTDPLDIAVLWSNSYGVFMTNGTGTLRNQGSPFGRVNPNYDPVIKEGEAYQSVGSDAFFTNFVGFNGSSVVTTFQHRAFNITNSTFDDEYYITVSAENNNLGGGTFTAPNGGDAIPYWRALTVNTALQFHVQDDDASNPEVYEFTINGVGGSGISNLSAGSIAIIGVNGSSSADTSDPLTTREHFSFVVLAPFPSGTELWFTDGGWSSKDDNWWDTQEQHLTPFVTVGDADIGQIFDLNLESINSGGDQVLLYQYRGATDPYTDPTNAVFLFAVNIDKGDGTWDGWEDDTVDPVDTDPNPPPDNPANEESALPRGLTNGATAVSVTSSTVNVYYSGPTTGTASFLLQQISQATNWTTGLANNTDYVFTNIQFNVIGAGSFDWNTPEISDAQVLAGDYRVTNIVRDIDSGLTATNTGFSYGPYFMLFNTNSEVVVSNSFTPTYANGYQLLVTNAMTAPSGVYDRITLGLVDALAAVSDYDFDRQNDTRFASNRVPVLIYDDDTNAPVAGAMTLINGNTVINEQAGPIDLMAAWNFNASNTLATAGTGTWSDNLQTAPTYGNPGTTINAVSGDPAGVDITITGGSSLTNNGRYIQFQLGMAGREGLVMTYSARRSGTGFTTNLVSYSTDGVTFTDFATNTPTLDNHALRSNDFTSASALNNQSVVYIRITLDGATGTSGNNRFDNFQFQSRRRVYSMTDGALAQVNATNALLFSLPAYDATSGIARGTGANGTNMHVTIPGVATNNTANFSASNSTTSTTDSASTSVWSFTSFGYTQIGDLFGNGSNFINVSSTLTDQDNDRPGDGLWLSNRSFGVFFVTDDDTNAPAAADIRYNGFAVATKPFYVATNGTVLADEQIRGVLSRRSGEGSNTVWGVSDADLAAAGSIRFVFGARDTYSQVARGNTGSTNETMSFSVSNLVVGNFANYDAGQSSAQASTNITTTNVWSFADGFFTESMINTMLGLGNMQVLLSIPDTDDDRPNDRALLASQQVGYLRAIDDDIRGPIISSITVSNAYGSDAGLFSSFETSEGWPGSGALSGAWTQNVANGTWIGRGVLWGTLNPKVSGTRRIGLLTNDFNDPWIRLPPVTNAGSISLFAGRFGAEGLDSTIRVERLDGVTWVSMGSYAVTNRDPEFEMFTWDLNITGVATLRVAHAGTGPQVYLDDINVLPQAIWLSTNQLPVIWSSASDDYSGVDEYRVVAPAVGSSRPTATNAGSGYASTVTNQTISLAGQQGVITGFVFAIDNDNDRSGDRAIGNLQSMVVRIDTNPPPVATGLRATDASSGLLFGNIDESSEIKIEWRPGGTNEAQSAGWRQSDQTTLSPWDSYVITYAEVADDSGAPAANAVTQTITRDSASWTNVLNNWAFTNLVLSNLIFDTYYRVTIQGRDNAGNIGLSTSVIGNTDRFIVTQGLARTSTDLFVRWTGPTNESVLRDYDVLYVDSSTGFRSGLSNQWQFLIYTNRPTLIDQGGTNHVAPGYLTNGTYRFYRVARQGRWQTNNASRLGSMEVYVTKAFTLNPGENWFSLFAFPDPATTNEEEASIDYVFGTNLLPQGGSFADATKISWFGQTTGDTNISTVATATVWLGTSGWNWQLGGLGNAGEKRIPLGQGFLIEIPTWVTNPTRLIMIGRLPTQELVHVIAGRSGTDPEFHVLSQQIPERLTMQQFGNQLSGFTGGMNIGSSDEIRIMNNAPDTNGFGRASLQQPKARIWYSTQAGHAGAPWRYASSGTPSAMNYVIEPEDSIIIVRRNAGVLTWTNAPTQYIPPTKNFTP